jgi:hypothetical protein
MEKQVLQTEHVYWELREGILYAEYKKGAPINLLAAKIQVANRKEFTKGIKYPILIKDYGVAVIEKDARAYLTSQEGIDGIAAAAMVLTNVFSTFLGNYLIKINPPKMPVRIFKSEHEALAWLQQYKTKK